MKSDKRSILEVQDLGALDEDLGFEFLAFNFFDERLLEILEFLEHRFCLLRAPTRALIGSAIFIN